MELIENAGNMPPIICHQQSYSKKVMETESKTKF